MKKQKAIQRSPFFVGHGGDIVMVWLGDPTDEDSGSERVLTLHKQHLPAMIAALKAVAEVVDGR